MLPSPSSLCWPHDRPINQETRCWSKEYDFIQKAGRPRRWQTNASTKPSYRGLDASFFYRTEKGRRWGSKVKRPLSFANIPWNGQPHRGDVVISSFLQLFRVDRVRMSPWTKALWFNIQPEGQGSPRQAITYRQYPFSEEKQRKTKVKVKETDPTCSQIWLFPVTYGDLACPVWSSPNLVISPPSPRGGVIKQMLHNIFIQK